MLPDWAKFRHLGKNVNNYVGNYLVFGKIVNLLWKILELLGKIVIVVKGQRLKSN